MVSTITLAFHSLRVSPPSLRLFTSLIFLAITLFCVIIKFFFLNNNENNKPQNLPLPPGPKPWPIIGSLPEMLSNKPIFRWLHKIMDDYNTEISCIRVGNVHIITVSSPEISREFLKKQDANFASRPVSMSTEKTTKGFKTAALVPYGDQWKKMRRVLISEVVSPARHKWFYAKRCEEADHLVRYVYNQWKDGKMVDMRIASQQYCGNVIRKMVFNKRFFGQGSVDGGPGIEEVEHVEALFSILQTLYSFCVSDYFPFLRGRVDLDGHEKTMNRVLGVLEKYHQPLVDERIGLWRDGLRKDVEDVLDVFINLKDSSGRPLLSEDEIYAEITELMIATVDNPSNAVEWGLAEMVNHPDILKKAIEELDNVVGKERLVQESDFVHLNYIKACARETFRLHPIAPFNVPHVSIADTTVANYFIPKGSHLLLSRPGLGRNPKVWSDPLKFKPERHLNEKGTEVVLTENDLKFLSFSTGRRGCLGVTLGSSMTITLFARIIQCFSLSAPDDEPVIDLSEDPNSLFMAKPLKLNAKPRLAEGLYPV